MVVVVLLVLVVCVVVVVVVLAVNMTTRVACMWGWAQGKAPNPGQELLYLLCSLLQHLIPQPCCTLPCLLAWLCTLGAADLNLGGSAWSAKAVDPRVATSFRLGSGAMAASTDEHKTFTVTDMKPT